MNSNPTTQTKYRSTCGLLVLCASLCAFCEPTRTSFVLHNSGVSVPRGREVFVDPEALRISAPSSPNDPCRVEIVKVEAISQRVGKLTPAVFDCYFKAQEVKYTHNGSPLLDEDRVLLRLFRFTDLDTYVESFWFHVSIVAAESSSPGPAWLGDKLLQVSSFLSVSGPLNAEVLHINPLGSSNSASTNLSCIVKLLAQELLLPTSGHLIILQEDLTSSDDANIDEELNSGRGDTPHVVVPFKSTAAGLRPKSECEHARCEVLKTNHFSCDHFLHIGLRYEHLGASSPDVDYVPISVELSDTYGSLIEAKRLWLPVHIDNAGPNHRPIVTSFSDLDVDQFVLTPLTTNSLDAQDEETPRDHLKFALTQPPDFGFFTHLDDHTKPIKSFSRKDLSNLLIAYQPPNASSPERCSFKAEFMAYDAYFAYSSPIILYITIRTTDTNAPRVSWNAGLDLLEGQSRPLTRDIFQVVDNDNLAAVRLMAVAGLNHGKFTVRGGRRFMFSVQDIVEGVVRYHHDDSDTTSDYVVLRITDGQHSIRHKFPIHIVPKDDSPPFLLNHLALELCKGETVTLTSVLKASDTDSRDELIKFTVMKPPQEGRLLLKTRHNTLGKQVTSFRQHDLLMGKISYHHLGGDKTQDSFEFFLDDSHEPPNHSDKQVMIIHIIPLDDKIPTEVPGTMRNMVVNETDVVLITKEFLHFTDVVSPPNEIMFSITTPCHIPAQPGQHDAGRLLFANTLSQLRKDPTVPALLSFTQHAVNHFKVAYMPPIEDIGPNSILVQFGFMVTDEHGGTIHEQFFNITVLPVDNQMPEVKVLPIQVAEGDAALLLPRHIMVKDPDTIPGNLRVLISRNPLHGSLEMDGVILFEGDSIALDHIVARRIRYQHDGSETLQDDVALTVTDRTNSVDVLLQFKITPVNDEPPMLISGLEATLSCLEGGNAVITPSHLFAKDADSEESRLLFMVARSPSYGLVLHNGTSTDHFMQSDIEAATITYIHTGGEIGHRPSYDHVTIIISDAEAGGGQQRASSSLHLLPVYDLNITILPVDNQPPKLIIGDVLVVEETSKVALQRTHIWATDTDTHPDQLELMLVSPPRHGYLEDIRPLLGHERSNAGLSIGSFPLGSIAAQTVNYVQSRHKGTESTADIMLLYASDGIRRSKELSLHVVIKPINDEVPTLLVQNITVVEGEMKKLGPSLLNAEDADMPRDSLTFTFVKPPSNGAIMGSYQGQSNQPLITFTMEQQRSGLEVIYVHDDSDSTTDAFSVSLSDGKHEVYGTVNVTVIPVNDELPIVTRNTGLEIEPGDERVISSATLEASDKDSARSDVLFILTDEPVQGQLELKVGAEWKALALGANFSQDDVDENRVRYVHSGRPSANTEDLFRFRLWDGNNQSPVYPFLLVLLRTPKGEIELLSKPMVVGFGDRTTLSPNLLSAWDGSGRPDKLLFVVRRPPVHGTLEHVAHRGLPISTFTQLDLMGNTVCYAHEGVSRALTNDTISFFVSNGHSSQNGSMSIIVETQDNASPVVERNEGLHVSKGSNAAISSKSLRLGDPGKSSGDLTYLVTELPLHGTLYLHGDPLTDAQCSTFSQEDLNQQRVVYQHDGGASSLDRFSFVATDSVKCGPVQRSRIKAAPVMFKIQVEGVDNSRPHLLKIKTANSVRSLRDGRFGIVLSTRHLMVTDSPNADHEITFSIVRPPTFGYLEHIHTGEIVQTRFTQKDLEERNIVYVINPELDVTSDSLEFELSDAIRSSVNTHTLQVEWSRVQMGTASMRVCENDGSVKIPLIRQGCASDSAFIAIRAQGLSAIPEKDFAVGAINLVQFDPGVLDRSWHVTLLADSLEEPDERLIVDLHSPVGAVLGPQNTTVVIIEDAQRGRCHTLKGGGEGWGGGENRGEGRSIEMTWHGHSSPANHRNGKELFTIKLESLHPSVLDLHAELTSPITFHGLAPLKLERTSPNEKSFQPRAPVRSYSRHLKSQSASESLMNSHEARQAQRPTEYTEPAMVKVDSSTTLFCPSLHLSLEQMKKARPVPLVIPVPQSAVHSHLMMRHKLSCSSGWTQRRDRCFVLSAVAAKNWVEACRTCRDDYHSNLTSVSSRKEMQWLWDFGGSQPFWIGLNDRHGRGRWKWANGDPVSFTNWDRSTKRTRRLLISRRKHRTPSFTRDDADSFDRRPWVPRQESRRNSFCALVHHEGRWAARSCRRAHIHPYVCSRPAQQA